ncbi:aspartyl protease [Limnofasciculus baicalensis]|uniref:Aspartyl protease n=1 Tax=Limnofasciculus baicalensis BBK-W-15 TaxID=2699891 RepID=A0AAE3GWB3_9CYAN|nr:aspartyl protease [Limnofasciculus baicalensis]MCP2731634.1 aspartyl protease [Limnofasciculus baicalensis BBK-W-15]
MISGTFGDIGELNFEIDLIAGNGERFPVDVLLDTGFTTGWLAMDIQDVQSLGWSIIETEQAMQMARGEEFFDIYEGKVVLDGQEYIIPVLAAIGIPESILGLQWLKILPLAVNFTAGVLTLG